MCYLHDGISARQAFHLSHTHSPGSPLVVRTFRQHISPTCMHTHTHTHTLTHTHTHTHTHKHHTETDPYTSQTHFMSSEQKPYSSWVSFIGLRRRFGLKSGVVVLRAHQRPERAPRRRASVCVTPLQVMQNKNHCLFALCLDQLLSFFSLLSLFPFLSLPPSLCAQAGGALFYVSSMMLTMLKGSARVSCICLLSPQSQSYTEGHLLND